MSSFSDMAAKGFVFLLLFSQQAQALGGSQTLIDFSIVSVSQRFELSARAAKASLGGFTPLLAALNVHVELRDKKRNTSKVYLCSSFTFEMNESFATCELANRQGSVLFDFENSEVGHYAN